MKEKRSKKVLLSFNDEEMKCLLEYSKKKGLACAAAARMLIRQKLDIVNIQGSKNVFK